MMICDLVDHKVNNVQKLYDDALWLNNNVVMSAEVTADSILRDLSSRIENLKSNLNGKNAGV